MKKNTKKTKDDTRYLNIEVASEEDGVILNAALKILDKAGYTICRKDDFIIQKEDQPKLTCSDCIHSFTNPFDQTFCSRKASLHPPTRTCKYFKQN